jgi:tetratricopeptide (TPR) repeat protein
MPDGWEEKPAEASMSIESVSHFCQKCLAANRLGQEFCTRCGTRLMLVVEPAAVRFDMGSPTASFEEHLLERVSALENRLAQVTERIDHALSLLLRQAHNAYLDHALVETLIRALTDTGAIIPARLEGLWQARCEKDAFEQEEANRREELQARIVANYRGSRPEIFEKHVIEGMTLLGAGDPNRGIRSLERAVVMAADNAPLLSFIGEHFFRFGKMTLARDYLVRALVVAPENYGISLLLGLAFGDEGELEKAKELLRDVTVHRRSSFAAHYALGRLLATEQDWPGALAHFKSALSARPSPEAHYVLGCVYYQIGKDRIAQRHLRKAVEMDGCYAAAFYMLGLVALRMSDPEQAQAAFKTVEAIGEDDANHRFKARKKWPESAPASAPLFRATRNRLMSGDKRLASALREDALKTLIGLEVDKLF